MRVNLIADFSRMLFLLLFSSSFLVAQNVAFKPAAPFHRQVNLPLPVKSEIEQRVDRARERTSPGYYLKMYDAKSSLAKQQTAALRIAYECGPMVCNYSALPVTLISFKGQRTSVEQVLLNWETSSETNNAGFDIERSFTTTGFEKVGFVDGAGNSVKSKVYTFPDRNDNPNVTYYRLRQHDHDGTSEYSRIIAVNGFRNTLSLIAVPNPGMQSASYLQIRGDESREEYLQFEVTDVKGALLYKNDRFVPGSNKRIPLSLLPALERGLYVAKIISGSEQTTASFVIGDR